MRVFQDVFEDVETFEALFDDVGFEVEFEESALGEVLAMGALGGGTVVVVVVWLPLFF